MYKVYYRGEDAGYPMANTPDEALDFYIKGVVKETGESREEILGETWTSPRGVEKCVEVRKEQSDVKGQLGSQDK